MPPVFRGKHGCVEYVVYIWKFPGRFKSRISCSSSFAEIKHQNWLLEQKPVSLFESIWLLFHNDFQLHFTKSSTFGFRYKG